MFVETKTRKESAVHFQNWNTIHHPGNIVNTNVRGGSLIQIHPKHKLNKSNALSINNPLNECLHISTPFQGELLHIFLIYNHPTSLIEEAIFRNAALHKFCVIIGDFNVNTRQKKSRLNRFLRNFDFEIHTTDPTFIMPNNGDTTPDLIVYSRNLKNNFEKVEVVPDLGADHLAIQISFNLATVSNPENHSDQEKYRFYKCDIDNVNQQMVVLLQKSSC